MANPLKSGPAVSPVAVAAVLCLLLGGVAGYAARLWTVPPGSRDGGGGAPPMMGGMGGMGGGGGGMGGGGGQANPRADLTNAIRGLFTIEKVVGADLKADQAAKVLQVAEKLQSAKSLSEEDCKRELDALNQSLTEDQKAAIEAIRPRFGGGGGGGMGGMMGGMGKMGAMSKAPPGFPVSAMGKAVPVPESPMGGGGGGGGGSDNPFAEGPNKERLDALVDMIKKKSG